MKRNRIISFLRQYKFLIFICVICVILEIISDLLSPIILSDTINVGVLNSDINYIIKNIIIMLIILLIGIIGSIVSTFLASKISNNVGYHIRDKIVKKVLNIEYKEVDKLNIGYVITLLTNDISAIENIIFLVLKLLVKVPLIIIGSIFLCLTISIKMSSILLIIIPIIIIISVIFVKKTFPYFNLTNETLDDINSNIRENISNIKLVKSESNEKYEMNKFDKKNKKFKDINKKALLILSLMMPIIIFIINITTIIILIMSKIEIENGNFLIGNVTAFIEYINLLLQSIISTSMIFLLVIESSVSIKRINKLLNIKEEYRNIGLKTKIKGNIEFKSVYFSYNEKYNLENINLNIKKGEKVAIIGESGSGKSTLINLLNRNYETLKGEILIDSTNIKDYDLNYLKEKVLIVNQKSNVFKDTIVNNITFKKKKDISKYTKITLFDKVINKKENNLKFKVEQNGKNLSGGEKQRLILTRSIVNDFDILVLDDSMSALDLKTENKVIDNLLKKYKDKTIIYVTNRISNIKNFDKIILLNNGKIEQIGKHEDLLNNQTYIELSNIGEVL